MKTNITNADELKEAVRRKYDAISRGKGNSEESGCCSSKADETAEYTVFSDDYTELEGYISDADLGLGCGLPTEFARIESGDTVVDLGSGAGNDCFVARREVGEQGRVIGIDFSEAMVEKARQNVEKLGYDNIEFVHGDIESMPLDYGVADVVVSNCVMNLVPDKMKAFEETYRILKPGGHFSISDIVTIGELPGALKQDAELYAGCVAGAVRKNEYLSVISQAGFQNIDIQKQKTIDLPDELLLKHLSPEELDSFRNSGNGIISITVYAEKPGR